MENRWDRRDKKRRKKRFGMVVNGKNIGILYRNAARKQVVELGRKIGRMVKRGNR